jgi:hypothetical protein
VVDVAKTRATRGAVQREILVAAERTAVQPGNFIGWTAHPLTARR